MDVHYYFPFSSTRQNVFFLFSCQFTHRHKPDVILILFFTFIDSSDGNKHDRLHKIFNEKNNIARLHLYVIFENKYNRGGRIGHREGEIRRRESRERGKRASKREWMANNNPRMFETFFEEAPRESRTGTGARVIPAEVRDRVPNDNPTCVWLSCDGSYLRVCFTGTLRSQPTTVDRITYNFSALTATGNKKRNCTKSKLPENILCTAGEPLESIEQSVWAYGNNMAIGGFASVPGT